MIIAVVTILLAVALAAVGLFGRPAREALPAWVHGQGRAAVKGLRSLHSGHVGDYVAWWTTGVAVLGTACLVMLR